MTERYDTFSFIRGQADCREGLSADLKGNESYQAGYSAEYQLQEINSHNGINYGTHKKTNSGSINA